MNAENVYRNYCAINLNRHCLVCTNLYQRFFILYHISENLAVFTVKLSVKRFGKQFVIMVWQTVCANDLSNSLFKWFVKQFVQMICQTVCSNDLSNSLSKFFVKQFVQMISHTVCANVLSNHLCKKFAKQFMQTIFQTICVNY